ncbi:hypothetical protein EMPS_10158 [Entomortierella parvispora]|uniref:Transmembrane protein n=1 Tax=Entomortierella parvispora TaxID=205924 RepID=A0A9P3M0Y8_9FUNG|nr:hypothetical protein EMPS_10158 [Entomortierella parvispora]
MEVSIKTMRRIAGTAVFISLICFCLDCYRTTGGAQSSTGYLIVLFLADIWGFLPYSLLTLGKKSYGRSNGMPIQQNRRHQILGRLFFFVLALIAPLIQLVNAENLNAGIQNMSTSQMLDLISGDPAVACWGAFGKHLKSYVTTSPSQDEVFAMCGAMQARTVLMLIVGLLVMVETVLYARSDIGTEEWVQEELKKNASDATHATAAIEMDGPGFRFAPAVVEPTVPTSPELLYTPLNSNLHTLSQI